MRSENKWHMHRAGLLNFWYYDEETFEFEKGKLLLRGSNGSGKSVTMQSFLPVLLDGRKSPDRLDPFGSKARRMEDYLLGEKEVVDREERTGYLFIEYKRENSDQYITTGIGLQAKRQKPMKFWGFVISDNRRVGEDFLLYKEETESGKKKKVPFSRIELENRIGDGGTVVQTQTEYMKLVNRHIFGFDSLEAYEELIKLLIQIRSPKLSKEYRPTAIYEILEAALPPLTDEDLRHLSDTIEQMDQTKQQMEQLDRELTALHKLNRAYSRYNKRLLADQANEYQTAAQTLTNEQQKLVNLKDTQEKLAEEVAALRKEIEHSGHEKMVLEKQQERLRTHKIWDMEKELSEEKVGAERREKKKESLENKLDHKERQERETKQRIEEAEEEQGKLTSEINAQLDELDTLADEASFSDHEWNVADYHRHPEGPFAFDLWKKEAERHFDTLEETEELLRTFEALQQKMMVQRKELDKEQYQFDQLRHQERDWSRTFDEEKEKQIAAIRSWMEASEEVNKNGEAAFQEASRALYQLFEEYDYEDVRSPFRKVVERLVSGLQTKIAETAVAMQELEKKQDDTTQELQTWKDKKDPEPDTDESTMKAREDLVSAKVAFEPLYAAIEFQDHVPEDLRARIESTLLDAGLLDALVVNSTEITVQHDRLLQPNPQWMRPTLADYVRPELREGSLLTEEQVDDVLRTIEIGGEEETGTFSMNENGAYQIGIVHGHARPYERVRFVGRTARERYRREQIEWLEEQLRFLNEEHMDLKQKKNAFNTRVQQLEEHQQNFPDQRDLQEIWRQLEKTRVQIEQLYERISSLSAEVKELDRELQNQKRLVDEKTALFSLEPDYPSYRSAKNQMMNYSQELVTFQRFDDQKRALISRLRELSERLEEVAAEVDEVKGEVNVESSQLEGILMNIEQLEEQLASAGAEDIRTQIQQVQQQLQSVTSDLETKKDLLPRKETLYENGEQQIFAQERTTASAERMKELWQITVEKEWKRYLVFDREEFASVDDVIREAIEQYSSLLKENERSTFERQLSNQFYEQQNDLMEYRMKNFQEAAEEPDWLHEVDMPAKMETWKWKTTRSIIELNMRGMQVNPYTVEAYVTEEKERQEDILNEKDKELYEEILFKSVGMKLRSRIRRAEKWTAEMNNIMQNRNISSGLSFSIKWRPRTAENEQEMDTKDLVHTLKQDAHLLKDEDLERITNHFRSRIARAKHLIEEQGEGQTLLQVLKEVLDYRKWFSFVLSYQRTNEPLRELTNNKFYTFSGGEKALAMYIPLLAACYSRYQEASDEAPYIISLDEAFAGVDENNIREMFEVVETLGFDYIMNSQVLWGDYDTIPALSIYELLRQKNADYVTTIHYRWNGQKIAMATEDLLGVTT